MNSNYVKPALISGAVFGTASAVPFIGCLNIFCCALAIGGGLLGTFLYFREAGGEPQPFGSGAIVGLLTGVIGAVFSTIISVPFRLLGAASMDFGQIEEMIGDRVDIPPELQDLLASGGAAGLTITTMIIGFFFSLVLYALFAMVGGLIGAALFGKR